MWHCVSGAAVGRVLGSRRVSNEECCVALCRRRAARGRARAPAAVRATPTSGTCSSTASAPSGPTSPTPWTTPTRSAARNGTCECPFTGHCCLLPPQHPQNASLTKPLPAYLVSVHSSVVVMQCCSLLPVLLAACWHSVCAGT